MASSEQKESKPMFILLCGAQKAGTTWLWNHFAVQHQFLAGFKKEPHFLWHIFGRGQGTHHRQHCESLTSEMQSYLTDDATDGRKQALRSAMHVVKASFSLNDYAAAFRWLSATTHLPVADFTPENCLLREDQLSRLRDVLRKHFDVKVVYIMRDPAERLLSWAKHLCLRHPKGATENRAARGLADVSPLEFAEQELEQLRAHKTSFSINHSRYDLTVTKLDSVFEDVKYLFYENMFQQDKVDELSRFVGVEPAPGRFELRANQDASQYEFPENILSDLRQEFRDVYQFVQSRFPDAPLEYHL